MSTYSLNFEDNGETIRCDAKNDGFSIFGNDNCFHEIFKQWLPKEESK